MYFSIIVSGFFFWRAWTMIRTYFIENGFAAARLRYSYNAILSTCTHGESNTHTWRWTSWDETVVEQILLAITEKERLLDMPPRQTSSASNNQYNILHSLTWTPYILRASAREALTEEPFTHSRSIIDIIVLFVIDALEMERTTTTTAYQLRYQTPPCYAQIEKPSIIQGHGVLIAYRIYALELSKRPMIFWNN